MGAKTFQQVLERRNELLHNRAVWSEVCEHLSKFLDTDSMPAKQGITTQGEGLVVPQPLIEKIVGDIKGDTLYKIDVGLEEIDNREVAENVEQEAEQEKPAAKRSKSRKAGSKRSKTKAAELEEAGEHDGPERGGEALDQPGAENQE